MNDIKEAATPESNGHDHREDTKKFLISVDRDTGFHQVVEAIPPVERIIFGYHVLPFIGTYSQTNRLAKKFNRRPYLTSKYSVL